MKIELPARQSQKCVYIQNQTNRDNNNSAISIELNDKFQIKIIASSKVYK